MSLNEQLSTLHIQLGNIYRLEIDTIVKLVVSKCKSGEFHTKLPVDVSPVGIPPHPSDCLRQWLDEYIGEHMLITSHPEYVLEASPNDNFYLTIDTGGLVVDTDTGEVNLAAMAHWAMYADINDGLLAIGFDVNNPPSWGEFDADKDHMQQTEI